MKNLKFLSLLITAKQNCSRYIRHYVDSGEKLTIMTKGNFQYLLFRSKTTLYKCRFSRTGDL